MKLSKFLLTSFLVSSLLVLPSCEKDADVVSRNISVDADNFKIPRRVVFYNGINGEYILEISGLCSLGNNNTNKRLSVTCKINDKEYKKHFLGLSDNVTFFAEQLNSSVASAFHYRVVFKPSVIIPSIEMR